MRKVALKVLLPIGAAIALTPAIAHHSFAMFDRSKEQTVVGTLKELQWTNPHIWIQVTGTDKGKPVEWSIEGGSPNNLVREGWSKSIIKPGDKIEVTINPLKDGTRGGSLVKVKLASGKVLAKS